MTSSNEPGELELPGLVRDRAKEGARKAQATRARKQAEAEISPILPVAHVLLDLPGAHLDRVFDYAVPVSMAEAAEPGVRVKAKFGTQDADGFLIARSDRSEHTEAGGRLAPLRRVVGTEPVLTEEIAALAAAVAEHYAGTRSDVLRLAIPPRHAATERLVSRPTAPPVVDPQAALAAWAGHEPAGAFLRHLATGGGPRAVWHAAPGTDWATLIAHAVAAALSAGRGAVVCVPEHKDIAGLSAALDAVLGEGQHVVLTADQGPAPRYSAFLALRRGAVKVAIGTRAAIWAPVADLGIIAVWDEGDELLSEPRSPYPQVREVARLRAELAGAGFLVGGFARSAEAQALVQSGWAHDIAPTRALSRSRLTVSVPGASDISLDRDPLARATRLPTEAHDLIRSAAETGPVLVQVPRRGYAAALACDSCRTPARCSVCTGPLHQSAPATPPACRWCGTVVDAWQCAHCGGHGLRAPVVGDARTAEELGRSFPGLRVVSSSGERILPTVSRGRTIVVATPGAEPAAEGGYAAVVLLDTWLALGWPGLRADEDVLRRYSNALGLAGPGGRGMVIGDPAHPVVQALVRWDQSGYVAREMAERASAHLPPAARLATITGDAGAVDDALTILALPPAGEVLGPVPDGEQWRAVVRTPVAEGAALAVALAELARVRAARRLDPVRIQLDPPSI
ncbi:primosomal protein N' [Nocardioides sp. Kera G14]|uniref:primosomal protein N' n=1 Tax=Nocardioides sp. Kera G14 TaxID=2884264 RepID=UPI001D12A764|nr:primosomal protein N' [Nocardioides sp. Kera G14]UDY25315.1 primosomal protein N' [Nocardioides sp. Kera G14]